MKAIDCHHRNTRNSTAEHRRQSESPPFAAATQTKLLELLGKLKQELHSWSGRARHGCSCVPGVIAAWILLALAMALAGDGDNGGPGMK
ncbi:uncharacterized protein LOC118348769 isoform X3 [Juglans regia]|uniref:Uncharacterized protein LOC118348769 isoform X3 n=1 Tax=Juglans regia TaxID=51240 RepID=A0A6P9EFP8_JUGRE|nr:uncharacterized protein LOC118348769 isoform X3 [Juglans regia]